jgi:cytoskeleton protein RodZ
MLRQAREAMGLHISVLATTLRVPVERLRALEAERWADLPDMVFARALAMSVCRQLKVDSAAVLAAMPDPDPLRSVRLTAATGAPIGGWVSRPGKGQRLWFIGSLLLLIGLIGLSLGWPVGGNDHQGTSVETPEMPAMQLELPPAEEALPQSAGNQEGVPANKEQTLPIANPAPSASGVKP